MASSYNKFSKTTTVGFVETKSSERRSDNMSNYEIIFKVDGKIITQEKIREVELSRYHLVFKEMYEHEITPLLHGAAITKNVAEQMDLDDLKECLAETRENLGRERIREIYKKDLEKIYDTPV